MKEPFTGDLLKMESMAIPHEGGSSADELLAGQAHVFNHALSHIGSLSLKCAIELGIPDAIDIHGHGQPLPLSQLVTHLNIPPSRAPYLRRLMCLLTHMGYFTIKNDSKVDEDDDAYSLTVNSKIILKSSPTSLNSWLLITLDPHRMSNYQTLSNWYRQAEPATPFEMIHGCSMWDRQKSESKLKLSFNNAMASVTQVIAPVLVTNCKDSFQGLSSLVDVGGGNGTLAIALATAFPHIKFTVYDLPHVVSTIPETKLVEAVGGNMFEYIPRADAVLLKWILHDWSDEECVKILKLCREAIPAAEKGGKVMIVDIVLNKDDEQEESKRKQVQLYWDMVMLTIPGGKERGESEWKKVFTDSGFRDYKITPLGLQSLIELFP